MGLTLDVAAPNPFTSTTTIAFTLPGNDVVTLTVYTLNGRRVGTVVDAALPRGRHELTFDATGLASGVYVVRLATGTAQVSRRITLVR